MGISPSHSSNVSLVLNLKTGTISPQFHVVFDDYFTTVMSISDSDDPPGHWENLFHESQFHTEFDEHEHVSLHVDWLTSSEQNDFQHHKQMQAKILPRMNIPKDELPTNKREFPLVPLPSVVAPSAHKEPAVSTSTTGSAVVVQSAPTTTYICPVDDQDVPMAAHSTEPAIPGHDPPTIFTSNLQQVPPTPPVHTTSISMKSTAISTPRRSTRTNFGVFGTRYVPEGHLAHAFFSQLVEESDTHGFDSDLAYLAAVMTDPTTGLLECSNPLVYAAMARRNDPDNPRYHEAMASIDHESFKAVMITEIVALTSKKTWTSVTHQSVQGKNILPGIRAFKLNLFPDGSLRDLQVEGVDFFETYAPVVQWSTVRALLVMSIVLNLATQQIDFSNAFCQADIDEEVYVEMPKDFGDPRGRDMVLRLNKSLYGTKQAPRTWFLKLKECLEQRGFTQSLLDPCLFIHADMVYLVYVDDSILIGRDRTKIDAMIENLAIDLELTREGDLAAFLGIQINKSTENGSLKLTSTQ